MVVGGVGTKGGEREKGSTGTDVFSMQEESNAGPSTSGFSARRAGCV